MRISGNQILITGGGTGIGFALAEAFTKAGSEVAICGRREDKLSEAKAKLPSLRTHAFDLSDKEQRIELFNWALDEMPGLNVLVNNAGIQREVDLKQGIEALEAGDDEVEINFKAPIHLTALFMPHLLKQSEAAIVNVSSGLGFVPMAIAPIYCATKAATHSFSLSLRRQLRGSSVKVFEVIPPTVDTELDRGARAARGQKDRGIPATEVADAALAGFAADQFEVAVGQAANLRNATGTALDEMFNRINH